MDSSKLAVRKGLIPSLVIYVQARAPGHMRCIHTSSSNEVGLAHVSRASDNIADRPNCAFKSGELDGYPLPAKPVDR